MSGHYNKCTIVIFAMKKKLIMKGFGYFVFIYYLVFPITCGNYNEYTYRMNIDGNISKGSSVILSIPLV